MEGTVTSPWGANNPISKATASVVVTYKNPCIDPNRVTITGPPAGQLGAPTYQFGDPSTTTAPINPPVTVTFTPSSIESLCGTVSYLGFYNNVAMTGDPISYNPIAGTFTIGTNDPTLIGTDNAYSIKVQLANYPDNAVTFVSDGLLSITGDPCDAPISFTTPASQPNFDASVNFANTVSFTLDAFTVNPA